MTICLKRAVLSVYCAYFSRTFTSLCVLFSSFIFVDEMWDFIVLVPDLCLSIYLVPKLMQILF